MKRGMGWSGEFLKNHSQRKRAPRQNCDPERKFGLLLRASAVSPHFKRASSRARLYSCHFARCWYSTSAPPFRRGVRLLFERAFSNALASFWKFWRQKFATLEPNGVWYVLCWFRTLLLRVLFSGVFNGRGCAEIRHCLVSTVFRDSRTFDRIGVV